MGDAAAPARALAVGGAALELSADFLMERRLHPAVRPAYEAPEVKHPHLAARVCTAAGAGMMLRRDTMRWGGLLLCAGSLLERVAIIRAGRASAADPAATVTPQRERASSAA